LPRRHKVAKYYIHAYVEEHCTRSYEIELSDKGVDHLYRVLNTYFNVFAEGTVKGEFTVVPVDDVPGWFGGATIEMYINFHDHMWSDVQINLVDRQLEPYVWQEDFNGYMNYDVAEEIMQQLVKFAELQRDLIEFKSSVRGGGFHG
jgi:hypothetical protein